MPRTTTIDRNMHILVIDDYPSMRRIVRNCLRQLGFENVEEADSGQAAINQLENGSFQFIISDWSVPDMSGGELLAAVRSNTNHKDTPLLVVAAEQERSKMPDLEDAGVIVKPFTRDILQKKMEEALAE